MNFASDWHDLGQSMYKRPRSNKAKQFNSVFKLTDDICKVGYGKKKRKKKNALRSL